MRESSSVLGLIMGREVRERARSGGFWVSTWLSVAAVVLALALPSLRHHDTGPLRIAAVGTLGPGAQRQLLALVTPPDALDLATLPVLVDQAQARAALRAHEVDVVVAGTDRIMTLDPLDRSAQDRRTALVLAVERVLASTDALQGVGLSEATIAKVQAAEDAVTVEAVTSSDAVIDRAGRRTTAAVGTALIALFSIVYGAWMLDGVLEEKSSRVVELLLTTVKPSQLLRGKVAGIGLVALLQGLLLTATALGAAGLFAAGAPLRDNKPLVLGILGWFLLGYCCYGSAFALAAAVSRRHAEGQAASFVVLAPLLAGAAVAAPTLVGQQPDGLLRVLSMVPFTSPVAMPAREALERVPAGQLAVAAGGLVATAALLLWAGARAYARSVLDPTRPWLSRAPAPTPRDVTPAPPAVSAAE